MKRVLRVASPIVLDACRYFAALLLGALDGVPGTTVLGDLFEPAPGLWSARPLRAELVGRLRDPVPPAHHRGASDVIDALLAARAEALQAADLASAMERSVAAGRDPALAGAITGALIGAFIGAEAIPPAMTGVLARLEVIEDVAARLAAVGADRR